VGNLVLKIVLILLASLVPLKQARAERGEPAFQAAQFKARTSAAQCTDLDARESRPQLKEFYATPKYQDGLGWCYASAAAEMVTHKIGRPVSAVDMAIIHNHEIHSSAFGRAKREIGNKLGFFDEEKGAYEGGFIRDAILGAKKYGICSAKRMPSQLERNPYLKGGLLELLKNIEAFNQYQAKKSTDLEGFSQGVECSGQDGWGVSGFKEYFPGVDVRSLYNLLVKEAQQDVNETLFDLAQAHCRQDRIPLKKLKVREINLQAGSSASWTKVLDAQLAKGNIAGISFYMRMLVSSADRWEGHATTVVARKFQYGECMYLVRDSSTQGCGWYRSQLQDLCDAKTQTLWVPETQMNRYLKSIDYLE
jgi:hypothetical protein